MQTRLERKIEKYLVDKFWGTSWNFPEMAEGVLEIIKVDEIEECERWYEMEMANAN